MKRGDARTFDKLDFTMPSLANKTPSRLEQGHDMFVPRLEFDNQEIGGGQTARFDADIDGPAEPGHDCLPTLSLAAVLAVPVSMVANLMGLAWGEVPFALQANEYWVALAILAALVASNGTRKFP